MSSTRNGKSYSQTSTPPTAPIAIIGSSGRFPGGANDLATLWKKLKAREDMVGEWPADRWDAAYYHPDVNRAGRIYTKGFGGLDKIDEFDAEFFSISPREASRVDPQHRLLLELAWEALQDAGQVPGHLAGSTTGVFIGISSNDYAILQGADPEAINAYSNAGGALSIASNRLSYFFDLHGPSMSIDTACSSSLVAFHEACSSLWSGESELAIAGGVNIILNPLPFVGFCKASMLARDGHCKSFDAAGDGFVRAEGGAVFILKPLAAAERDGDPIQGLVIATGVNSDGRTRGLSLPNEAAQEELLREIYSGAGVSPEDVFYMEAHGTGTAAGDPIECGAIGRVVGAARSDGEVCYLGSIKSNVGHMEPASGVAGIAKVLLALKNREIPPNLHFNTPNPKIDFEKLKLEVVTDPIPLPRRERPYVMGVNSFGFGGTNAHVAIQEYVRPPGAVESREVNNHSTPKPSLLLLSAQSNDALNAMAADYARLLRDPEAPPLRDICATAALRRPALASKLAALGSSCDELAERLERFVAGEAPAGIAAGRVASEERTSPAFVFCGNGPQWWAMGRELLESSEVFRATLTSIDEIFKPLAKWSILKEMATPESESRIANTEVAQPLLFALQVGLVAMLREAGIIPSATIGHSVGEVAAAFVAGALSLTDAVRVVFERSRTQATTAGRGRMAAAALSPDAIRSLIGNGDEWIEIAAINTAQSVTLAGDPEALERLGKRFETDDVFFRVLPLNYAFHSRAMDPIKEPLLEALKSISPRDTSVPFISTVSGEATPGTALAAEYWWRNIREPVQFARGIEALLARGVGTFLEIGPHPVLRDYVKQVAEANDKTAVSIATMRRPSATQSTPEQETFSTAVCACYANNAGADPAELFDATAPAVSLPAYPWQKQTFWSGSKQMLGDARHKGAPEHPLLGSRVTSSEPLWEGEVDPDLIPYLSDHVVRDSIIFPGAGYVEMAVAAAGSLFGDGPCKLEDVEIRKALVLPEGKAPVLQCVVNQDTGNFRISSRVERAEAGWTAHVVGKLGRDEAGAPPPVALDELRKGLGSRIDGPVLYERLASCGLAYGPAFRAVKEIYFGGREALGEIAVPEVLADGLDGYRIHPVLLDACLQMVLGAVEDSAARTGTYLPVFIGLFHLYATMEDLKFCHIQVVRQSSRSVVANFRLLGSDGRVLAEIDRFRFQAVDFDRASAVQMFEFEWQLSEAGGSSSATALPAVLEPGLIARKTAGAIERLVDEADRRNFYLSIRPAFDRLGAAYAITAIAALNADQGPFSFDQLVERGGVVEEHRKLLGRLIEMCVEDGLISQNAGILEIADAAKLPDYSRMWRQLMLECPQYSAELIVLGRAGTHLAAILRGEENSLQILFPQKGSATAEHLYDSSPACRFYNRVAAAAVEEIVAQWPIERPIRVLELGAGTGGLTATILPVLPDDRTSYTITDVSESFLGRARVRFEDYRFVRFATLDIERDPIEQGFTPGSFDLILAFDVLHVASQLRVALERVRNLLAPEGQLVLIEKHVERIGDLVFGQFPGFWNFTDFDLRRDSALLTPARWLQVLDETGFRDSVALSDANALPDGREALPQQSVFLARKADEPSPEIVSAADPERKPRRWLLLRDHEAPSARFSLDVKDRLAAAGDDVVDVLLDGAFKRRGPAEFTIATNSPEDLRQVLASLSDDGVAVDEIVHLAGLAPLESMDIPALVALEDRRCLSTINLVQAIAKSAQAITPRLTLVTLGAKAGPTGAREPDPAQAPLWGLGRVVMNEHPELRCRLIDLHIALDAGEGPARLIAELETEDEENEVLLTPRRRYVYRVGSTSVADQAAAAAELGHRNAQSGDKGWRLTFASQGKLDNLFLEEIERKAPGPNEVEVRVHAAGLNFHDVMWVMGLLPEEAVESGFAGPTIGMECSGVIERVGAGVSEFAPGDRVLAFGPACFSSHLITNTRAVIPMPAGMSFESAATIPTTFFTAYYALEHLARLEAGESILIHGAAGGVGFAAIQYAQLRGARIFGTAGSEEKRDVLRMMGVDHVHDSRSLAFADEILKITNGQGVDVVLNSLAGDAIWENLRVLKPFGRFLELGKRDYFANTKIGLRPFRNNLSYFGIDADQLMEERPELGHRLLGELMKLVADGSLKPLPYRSFPIQRASEAFRTMQQSRQIGKLILTMDEVSRPAVPPGKTDLPIRADGSYLVTGGLTGFGLATAIWLVNKGARHVALLGRRGAATDEAAEGIAQMTAAGAEVKVFAADVTDESRMADVFAELKQTMPPLRGVVHAAMALEDGIILRLDRDSLHRALDPKIIGACLLHRNTLDLQLDFFVLYSSATTFLGNPGQANYVAGCSYLETLAQYRRSIGLPGLAIGWGAIDEVGYVARNPELKDLLFNRVGMKTISPSRALGALEELVTAGAACVSVGNSDWNRLQKSLPSASAPKFSRMVGFSDEAEAGGAGSDFLESLKALESAKRPEAMAHRLSQLLGRVMGLSVPQLDLDKPIAELGIDSLMTVEIGSMIEDDLGVKVPAMEMMDGSVNAIANRLLALLGLGEGESPSAEANGVQKVSSAIALVRPAPVKNPAMRLVTFPYLAGNSSAFASWPARIGNHIELLSVQPPGREGGSIDGLNNRVSSFVAELGPRIIEELDRPYAFYGHSLGAIVAFELCRWLRAAGARPPVHLFLGAFSAPQLPNEMARVLAAWPEDILERASEALWIENLHYLIPRNILDDPMLLKAMIPVLRAEIEMVRQYQYEAEEPLDCPITCFAGSDDVLFSVDSMKHWEAQTTGPFGFHVVPGDHLFLRNQVELITDVIGRALAAHSGGQMERPGVVELDAAPSA